MCGIWGFVGRDRTVPVADAWNGLCSLEDRGPDDWGIYAEEIGKHTAQNALPDGETGVAIGNRRLSILDLSAAGNQPMTVDGRHWIVYNGEVYNYEELRTDLRNDGYTFDSDTDTEVILQAYRAYGPDCVERFRGMFAFAIWDTQDDTLFAARDRFGIKPFYYTVDEGRLAFASEITSFLDSDVVPGDLDPVSVDGFLTFGYVPASRTILQSVTALDPGSTLQYDRSTGDLTVDRYWTPTFDGNDPDRDRLRTLLEESIRLRLRSDVPVGAFLSGGLDSSTIVALMRRLSEEGDLRTFSIDFDREDYSETNFAEEVADAFGTDHTNHTVAADDIRADLDDIVAAMDQPTIDGVNTYYVSKATADAGLKVALSGLGSDELFFGYPSFDRVPRYHAGARRLYRLPRWLRRPAAGLLDRLGRLGAPGPLVEAADLVGSQAPFGASYLAVRGLYTKRQRRRLLDDVDPVDWDRHVSEAVGDRPTTDGPGNAVSFTELSWYMRDQLLRDTDAMSMTHSLEVRVPFLDHRLAEHVAGLAPDAKADGEKGLLKEAVSDELPTSVLTREKSGFTFPFADWLAEDLRELLETALSRERLARLPIDPAAADGMLAAFDRGDLHWSRVWALAVLALWVEAHLTEA